MSNNRRLNLISAHLTSQFPPLAFDESLSNYRSRGEAIDQKILLHHFYGESFERINYIRELVKKEPIFNHFDEIDISVDKRRERILQQIATLYFKANLSYEYCKQYPLRKFELLYVICDYDMSLVVRLVVHLVLYADTVQNLGTEKHVDFVKRSYSLLDYGCFAMTELGHGSNVAKLETTAIYDHSTREFILNSPTATSAKWWIGGAGKTSNMSAVFARLIVDGVDRGIHVFVVHIRNNETHDVMPGVVIGDCGKKPSMDGIDNGFILFRNYRVPYDSLLDKYSSITPEGKFKSHIKNKDKRLGLMMAGLISGRMAVVSGSEQNMKNGLTIALRFSAIRKQFGSNDSEYPILDYPLQQYRLIPYLAKLFAIRSVQYLLAFRLPFIQEQLNENPEGLEVAEFHAILSACKGLSTWYSIDCLQECREATGGLGYSSYAGLGRIKANADLGATWEGDNNVLIQQTGKFILKQFQRTFKGQHVEAPTLLFLQIDNEKINAYRAKFENSEQLENEANLVELMEYRINYILHQCIAKLQETTGNSRDVFEAWNKSQVFYIQELAKSYGELIMAKEFFKFTRELEAKCDKTGRAIRKLCVLYSVGLIEKHLGSFEELAMNAHHAKVVRDSLTRLCEELAEVSVKIIDTIAPPDVINGSVLGVADGQIYKRLIEEVEKGKDVYSKPSWLPLLRQIKQVKRT